MAAWHVAHAGGDIPWPTASVGKSYISTQLAALAIERACSTYFDKLEQALEGLQYVSIAGPLTIRPCDHQVQIGQATGQVTPADGKLFPFPFIGPARNAPIESPWRPRILAIRVAPTTAKAEFKHKLARRADGRLSVGTPA